MSYNTVVIVQCITGFLQRLKTAAFPTGSVILDSIARNKFMIRSDEALQVDYGSTCMNLFPLSRRNTGPPISFTGTCKVNVNLDGQTAETRMAAIATQVVADAAAASDWTVVETDITLGK
jgi:hypothetical protein